MHDPHISGTVQDILTNQEFEKLVFKLQNCIESTLKGTEDAVIFQDDVFVYGTTKEQFDKRMLAVKSQLREKNFTNDEKKSNSKPVDSVRFSGYSISQEGIAPDHKHAENKKMQ